MKSGIGGTIVSSKDSGCALVVGASRGYGKGIALSLAKLNKPIVIAARSADELEAVATDLRTQGAEGYAYPADLTDEGQADRLVKAALERYGQIDLLVNSVGVPGIYRTLEHLTWDSWLRNFNVDVKSIFNMCQQVVPSMRARGSGTIVNVSSSAATAAVGVLISYAPAKAAVVAFSRCLNASLEGSGVVVHCLCPDLTTQTDLGREAVEMFAGLEGTSFADYVERNPGVTKLSPAMVGDAVATLARQPAGGVWKISAGGLEPVDFDVM
jgi:3-oxoacyl-[acyl-carrier protein] reductase